jgi:hypothetical protein
MLREITSIKPPEGASKNVLILLMEEGVAPGYFEQDFAAAYRIFSATGVFNQGLSAVKLDVDAISDFCAKEKINRLTVMGVGKAGAVAKSLAAQSPGLVRRLILLNSTTRGAPGASARFIDNLEKFLPLGLPLRTGGDNFDSRSWLHRIGCPALVVSTRSASDYVVRESNLIAERIPNAYRVENCELSSVSLLGLVKDFMQTPWKRPQTKITRAKVTKAKITKQQELR